MRKGQFDPPVSNMQRAAFLQPYSRFVFAWEEICHFKNTRCNLMTTYRLESLETTVSDLELLCVWVRGFSCWRRLNMSV